MTTTTGQAVRSPRKRRWRVPPPLTQGGVGPGPEGLFILKEHRSELGVVLWKSLRSVTLWAETDPAYRANLFPEDAADRRQVEILSAVPDDASGLREALEDLLPILSNPETADPEFAGIACHRLATWAEQRNARRTELEFLQAAALCCPANPRFALGVGRTARDLAEYGRAEAWLYRAIGLARQSRDWESYVRAYLQHGVMMLRRGALPPARRSMLKALRRSRRQGFRQGEAWALHDLFVLESSGGHTERALAYAREAVAAHGPGHAQLPRLAHDIAYFWLESGDHAHALPVFLGTLGKVGPEARPTVLGSISRAAAGMEDVAAYEWAREELVACPPGPGVAEAWVEVARAALAQDRLAEAQEAAGYAESVARSRREGRVRFLAESVMEQIHAERAAAAALAAARERVAEPSPASDQLARELLRSLQDAGGASLATAGAGG